MECVRSTSTSTSITVNNNSQLQINNGGAVTAQTVNTIGTIGLNTGATLSTSGTLEVGGVLQVGAGATVVTPSLLLAPGGSIDLSGGGTITLGPSAPVTPSLNAFTTDVMPSAGMIQVNTGGTFNGGQFDLAPGVGSVTGSIVNQGGTVTLQGQAVGARASSHLNVSGDYTQQSGTLALLMGGTPFNGSNELHVSGNVSLAGVLELDIAPFQEFPLHVGENFRADLRGRKFFDRRPNRRGQGIRGAAAGRICLHHATLGRRFVDDCYLGARAVDAHAR